MKRKAILTALFLALLAAALAHYVYYWRRLVSEDLAFLWQVIR